ncbi:MAG: 23S rRNA (adenine(2030)-N(6))-methyltransferase RlmJ [Bdellovibrio sp.]|nr:23S rRNA (adenine(2030)-N(6))-methyltransferase RlmJ [Methylotenera sp.]
MLSYRHAFHAGNHADVLKHYVFSLVLAYMNQKPAPYWVIDTHAGAGMYELGSEFAQKNAEFNNGIARLFAAEHLPDSLEDFVKIINSFNENNALNCYSGSPKIAESLLRTDDKLRLFELHPSDYQLLDENFSHKGRQTKIEQQNGFTGIKACLPPPTKRGVVLIDPPYELKDDYNHVVNCIKDSLKRFATGTYLVWYPLLQRPEPAEMVRTLIALNADFLQVEMRVQAPSLDGYGMYGSGMLVVNPPYTLPKILEEAMPVLTQLLALDESADFLIQYKIA